MIRLNSSLPSLPIVISGGNPWRRRLAISTMISLAPASPMMSRMSSKLSTSRTPNASVSSAPRRGDAAFEMFLDFMMVGQTGERVLVHEPVHLPLAAGQQEAEPVELPHGEPRETDQAERDGAGERQQAKDERGGGPLRLPAEPADDAAIGARHRLDFAAVSGRLGVEFQALEARAPFQNEDELADRRGTGPATPTATPRPRRAAPADARPRNNRLPAAPARSRARRTQRWRPRRSMQAAR